MHSPYPVPTPALLDHELVLRLDRALRRARASILAAGAMSDALWAVLIELAGTEDGLSFEALEAGPCRHFGRTTLLGCLSQLEENEMILGRKGDQMPLLSHLRITENGRAKITAIIDIAAKALGRGA